MKSIPTPLKNRKLKHSIYLLASTHSAQKAKSRYKQSVILKKRLTLMRKRLSI